MVETTEKTIRLAERFSTFFSAEYVILLEVTEKEEKTGGFYR